MSDAPAPRGPIGPAEPRVSVVVPRAARHGVHPLACVLHIIHFHVKSLPSDAWRRRVARGVPGPLGRSRQLRGPRRLCLASAAKTASGRTVQFAGIDCVAASRRTPRAGRGAHARVPARRERVPEHWRLSAGPWSVPQGVLCPCAPSAPWRAPDGTPGRARAVGPGTVVALSQPVGACALRCACSAYPPHPRRDPQAP